MRFKRLFLLLALATGVGATTAYAGDDFGLWTGISAEKDFSKKFSVDGGLGFRSDENLSRAARWDVSVGAGYKPFKFLKFGVAYVFISDQSHKEYKKNYNKEGEWKGYNVDYPFWRDKHRAYFEAVGNTKLGRFKFSLRERYQYTYYMAAETKRDEYRGQVSPGYEGDQYRGYAYQETVTDDKKAKSKHMLRSRLKVEYNIKNLPLTPYASCELHNNIGDAFCLDKVRYSAGLEYKIKKRYGISLGYLYQQVTGEDSEGSQHVLDLSFSFKI